MTGIITFNSKFPFAPAHVIGNDTAITWAGANGNFELNVMMPVMAHDLLESIRLLANVVDVFCDKCVRGIVANEERCRELIELSMAMATSLAPKIDATLFVVRLSYTSARLVRKSLELLYNRQVNVPGVILNYVDTSLPEYYYYQYSEYYNLPPSVEEQHDDVAAQRHHQPRQIQSS